GLASTADPPEMILPAAVAVYRCAMNTLATPCKANRTGGQLGFRPVSDLRRPCRRAGSRYPRNAHRKTRSYWTTGRNLSEFTCAGSMWSPFAVTTCCGPNGSTAGRPCGPRSGHDRGARHRARDGRAVLTNNGARAPSERGARAEVCCGPARTVHGESWRPDPAPTPRRNRWRVEPRLPRCRRPDVLTRRACGRWSPTRGGRGPPPLPECLRAHPCPR